MSPPTKLRLLYERTKRAHDEAAANEYAARRRMEDAWLMYLKARRAEGFCANCEKPLAECRCVMLAAERASEWRDARPDCAHTNVQFCGYVEVCLACGGTRRRKAAIFSGSARVEFLNVIEPGPHGPVGGPYGEIQVEGGGPFCRLEKPNGGE